MVALLVAYKNRHWLRDNKLEEMVGSKVSESKTFLVFSLPTLVYAILNREGRTDC